MDIVPAASEVIVLLKGVPVIVEKLRMVSNLDCAEQAISVVEKLCQEGMAKAVLLSGGLAGVIEFLDFFPLSTQKKAISAASMVCGALDVCGASFADGDSEGKARFCLGGGGNSEKKGPEEAKLGVRGAESKNVVGGADRLLAQKTFETQVKPSLPNLMQLLLHPDMHIAASACKCWRKILGAVSSAYGLDGYDGSGGFGGFGVDEKKLMSDIVELLQRCIESGGGSLEISEEELFSGEEATSTSTSEEALNLSPLAQAMAIDLLHVLSVVANQSVSLCALLLEELEGRTLRCLRHLLRGSVKAGSSARNSPSLVLAALGLLCSLLPPVGVAVRGRRTPSSTPSSTVLMSEEKAAGEGEKTENNISEKAGTKESAAPHVGAGLLSLFGHPSRFWGAGPTGNNGAALPTTKATTARTTKSTFEPSATDRRNINSSVLMMSTTTRGGQEHEDDSSESQSEEPFFYIAEGSERFRLLCGKDGEEEARFFEVASVVLEVAQELFVHTGSACVRAMVLNALLPTALMTQTLHKKKVINMGAVCHKQKKKMDQILRTFAGMDLTQLCCPANRSLFLAWMGVVEALLNLGDPPKGDLSADHHSDHKFSDHFLQHFRRTGVIAAMTAITEGGAIINRSSTSSAGGSAEAEALTVHRFAERLSARIVGHAAEYQALEECEYYGGVHQAAATRRASDEDEDVTMGQVPSHITPASREIARLLKTGERREIVRAFEILGEALDESELPARFGSSAGKDYYFFLG